MENRFLTKEELSHIMMICGFHTKINQSRWPIFYKDFVIDCIKNNCTNINFFNEQAIDIQNIGRTSIQYPQASKMFCEIFQNKICLPEHSSFLKIILDSSDGTKQKNINMEIFSYLKDIYNEETIFKTLEDFIHEHILLSPNFYITQYLSLAIKYKNNIDVIKLKNITNNYIAYHKNYNTNQKTLGLKLIVLLNCFENNLEQITNYIENNQSDSLFINNTKKIIKNTTIVWNENDVPTINKVSITGNITFNSEFFIRKNDFKRNEAEKFINAFCQFMIKEYGILNFQYQNSELIIKANNIGEYQNLQNISTENFDKIKLLAPHWNKKYSTEESINLFKNFINKSELHENLINTLNNEHSTPKSNSNRKKMKI